MKSYLLLLAIVFFLASCSSVYKTGQTPDDVYYSPARPQEEYVNVEKQDDRYYRNDEASREDRYLRMRVRDRRYSMLDDIDYYPYNPNSYYRYNDYYSYNNYYNYNGYGYGYNKYNLQFGYTNPYYSRYANPYYYNPYYSHPYYSGNVYGNTRPVYNRPRTGNLDVYGNNYNNNSSQRPRSSGTTNSSNDNNYRGSNNNAGGFLRNVFSGSSNGTSNNSSTPSTNTSTPSSSSSSSSGSTTTAPARKF